MSDEGKKLLEALIAELYSQEAKDDGLHHNNDSYVIAGDGQYLGRITKNKFDKESLLNEYGPYGSRYSPTSMFNKYGIYGGRYGQWSPSNPYCSSPPQLFINGRQIGRISENKFITDRIDFDAFEYALKNNIDNLLRGQIDNSDIDIRIKQKQSFLLAHDGTFLGKLTLNRFDHESIFNQFGPYGSQFSQQSIFNNFSTYGGSISQQSPYNSISRTPPRIYAKGRHVAYLSNNSMIEQRVDPSELEDWVSRNIGRY